MGFFSKPGFAMRHEVALSYRRVYPKRWYSVRAREVSNAANVSWEPEREDTVKSWVEVSRERLARNYRALREVLVEEAGPGAALLAVVKADAYGHGIEVCVPVLVEAGATWLGVTDAAEGVRVRTLAGDAARILVMCGLSAEDAPVIVREGLTAVVWTVAQMEALAAAVGEELVAVHLEVDTGMSRQGVAVSELAGVLAWLAREPRLRLEGVMTHFASAEAAGSEQTEAQRAHFEEAVAMVAASGLRLGWVHAGNTSALDNGADGGTLRWVRGQADRLGARSMARAGLGLYGYSLPLAGLVASDGAASRLARRVLPTMTWKTRIVSVSEVEAGTRIGYNGSFVAPRAMRLALLPVGYADGLRRELSSTHTKAGGWVMVGGGRAMIVGRISMNLTTVDVTGMAGVAVGDEAVLLGDGITAEDHAALAGTIPYEILCGVRGEARLCS